MQYVPTLIHTTVFADLPFMPSTSKLNALPRVTENKEVDQEKDKQFSTIPAEKPLPSKKLVHTDSGE